MDRPQRVPGQVPQNERIEEYFKRLKKICQDGNRERKIHLAEEIARRINENLMLFLVKKLASDSPPCKMQVILSLEKVETPNEDVFRILTNLLRDNDPQIRAEASKVLAALAKDTHNLGLAKELLEGMHSEKKCALVIYGELWNDYPEEAILDLEKILHQEQNPVISDAIIGLFGEIGKKYPVKSIEILGRFLSSADLSKKETILKAASRFAEEHPDKILKLLTYLVERRDNSSRFVPEILSQTVDRCPQESFELLRNLAASDDKSIRYSIMNSLQNFKKAYPGKTLEMYFELWQKTEGTDDQESASGRKNITQEQIMTQFIEVAMYRPSEALSFLQILATSGDAIRRRNVLEAALALISRAPPEVFSLIKVFCFDSDYEIRKRAISSLGHEWNTFLGETVETLYEVYLEEIKKLQQMIEEIFSKNRQNPSKSIIFIKEMTAGDIKTLLNAIYTTATKLNTGKEEIPNDLLLDGITLIQRELVSYFTLNEIENWENGSRFLQILSRDRELFIRGMSMKIISRFLPKSLDTVLDTLDWLATDEISQVRGEALDFIAMLAESYSTESFGIIKRIYNSQNENVRIDIAKIIHLFKEGFPAESFSLLEKYSEDPNPEVRIQAAISLIEYADSFPEESLNIIRRLCQDNSYHVQKAAFDFLEEFLKNNSEKTLDLLETLYYQSSNPTTHEKIAIFLGNFKEKQSNRVMKFIEDIVRNPIGPVRSSAFSSFDEVSKYQPERALGILSTLSHDINPEIRRRVVKSIGTLNESYPITDFRELEHFLKDDDISVKIELALTLGTMGRRNPRHATEIYRKLISSMKSTLLIEAVADAMADYCEYCSYEAVRILFGLMRYQDEKILEKTEASLYTLTRKTNNFSYIIQNCFQESFFALKKPELLNRIEMIVKKTMYEEDDSYMREVVLRYKLYCELLKFSSITRIDTSEDLLSNHVENFQLVDESIEKALLLLKEVSHILGKQSFYSKRDDKIENLKDCLDKIEKTERLFEREFNEFDNPDRFILLSILQAWNDIISVEFVKLRGKAELKIILESKKELT